MTIKKSKSEREGLKRMKKYAKKGKMKTIVLVSTDESKIKHFKKVLTDGQKKSKKGPISSL